MICCVWFRRPAMAGLAIINSPRWIIKGIANLLMLVPV
nr:MAG TPA: hypothetical protein [Caudoviricetes sp.]